MESYTLDPSFTVKKINKRLHIVDANAVSVYSPPDFIRLQTRGQLLDLAQELEAGRPRIEAVIAWETSMRPLKEKKSGL